MQIQKTGNDNSKLLGALEASLRMAKNLPTEEIQLKDDRGEKGFEEVDAPITDGQLSEVRTKETETPLYEKLLQEHRTDRKHAPNAKLTGITETRLNDASKVAYPHRNEKAVSRTGDKRPINALEEEMGAAGDKGKRERFEKAVAAQTPRKRVVDKDIGEELTLKKTTIENTKVSGFNLRTTKDALSQYLAYKASAKTSPAAAEIDESLEALMLGFQDRTPTAMERARVEMLKKQKSQVLLMKTASEVCARCHKPANPHTMSQFNTDIICMACKEKERLHPKYREAADAEHVAIRGGDYNFKGIGAPADL